MPLPRILKQFLLLTIGWTMLCLGTEVVLGRFLGWGFPYDYPFVHHREMFLDFHLYLPKFHYFHSKAFFMEPALTYPAPTASLYKLFIWGTPERPIWLHLYLLAILVTALSMAALFCRSLIRRGLGVSSALLFSSVLFICSFPFWFEFHQANIEFTVWIVVTCGVWAHWRGKSWIAAACFGLAGAMKLFPFIFLGLLLSRRQYQQMLLAVGVAAVATVTGLWLLCPDLAYSWQQSNAAVASLRGNTMLVLWPVQSGFDHTLFCLFKRCLPHLPAAAQLNLMLNVYLVLAVCGGCTVYFCRLRKLPVVNQVLCFSVASILLPPVSYDYTLLHLYAPFALMVFLAISRPEDRSRSLFGVFFLFAFLLSLQSEFIFHGLRFAGQLRAVALLILFTVALIHPFDLASERTGRDIRV